MLSQNISRFLDSFDQVKISKNTSRSNVVKDYLLSTRCRIKEGLESDGITYLSTYGLSINSKPKSAIGYFERISDVYWNSVQRFYQQNGNPIQLDEKFKENLFENKLKERKDSYEIWLRYITSNDASYIPSYLHSWILHGLTKIGKYDQSNHKFKSRKPNTMDGFVTLYPDCLSRAVETMKKKIELPNHEFQDDSLNNIFKQDTYPTFKTLYQYFYSEKFMSSNGLLEVLEQTEGKWVEYNSEDQASEVSEILKNYPALEWCIKAESTAKTYLNYGSFYIYFSHVPSTHPNKEWVKYGYPRLCIRTNNTNGSIQIDETRGCIEGQGLDEVISKTDILETKLSEFGECGKEYIEVKSRLNRFNEIYTKYTAGQDLSFTEWVFVINCPITFLGYNQDQRVIELKEKLNRLFVGADLTSCNLENVNLNIHSSITTEDNFEEYEPSCVDLSGVNLTGVNMRRANLFNVNLAGANLSGADLRGADLRINRFTDVDFSNADLREVQFDYNEFINTNFTGADLRGVVFLKVDDLSSLNFTGADLRGTNMSSFRFWGANEFNFTGAIADSTTILPDGFDFDPKTGKVVPKFASADLRGVDLSEENLFRADLSSVVCDDTTILPDYKFRSYKVVNQRILGDCLILKKINMAGCDLSGIHLRESVLSGSDFRGANLTGANFNGADLTGVDFKGANLTGANLNGADLTGVDFRGANLTGASFMTTTLTGADLRGANLQDAILNSANLVGFDLQGVNLQGAKLQRALLTKANLSNANLYRANLINARLRETNFAGANLTEVDLIGAICLYTNFTLSDLTRARVNGADFSFATFNQTILTNVTWYRTILKGSYTLFCNEDTYTGVCLGPNAFVRGGSISGEDLSGINISGATIYDLNCSNSSLVNADLSDTYLEGVNFESVDFTGAYFTGAELNNVNFTGSNITVEQINLAILDETTILPDGMFFDSETRRVVEA